jgi:serine/threonine-protein kinase
VPSELQPLVGETIAGRYRVEKCIGVGGMAVVFLGRHEALDRSVAIKVLRPELEKISEVVTRFTREARIASHLEHPNCIQVFDVGRTRGGFSFMVMPFLDGTELSKVVSIPFAPSQAISLATQIATGLEYIHRCGVIHRDLKPDNVFATRDHEGRTVLRVVDFGVSKVLDGSRWHDPISTKVGTIVGTPSHMSPEQALGLDADPRSDLYALGIVLYQMLVAKLPFDHEDHRELMKMQIRTPPPELPEDIPEPVRELTMRLLSKRPEDRFKDAATLITKLKELSRTLASDPSPWRPVLPTDPNPVLNPSPALGGQTMVAMQENKRPSVTTNRPPSERSGHRVMSTAERQLLTEQPAPPEGATKEMEAALDNILDTSESRSDMLLDLLGDIAGIDAGQQTND